jgi:arylsulfatase A-like enzyme
MSAVFSGRYYSQLYFTAKSGRNPEAMYPHEDRSVRFPELLSGAGIDTVHLVGLTGLMVEYGIVRGFAEERLIPAAPHAGFAAARELVPASIERLERQGDKPLFMYLHFNDAHFPYDLGGVQGSPFDRYLGEVRGVDRELGRLLDALDSPRLKERSAIIVTADHGEGFGEHGQNFHATTLYEELLRVPLIIRGPNIVARDVREPVSLIDLAPTILDAFRQPTPGSFMGQSLVPLLAGQDTALHRPVIADSARLMRSVVFRDGMKLIEDRRRGTVELYDLVHDPAERDNLWDRGGTDAQSRLALLQAFFEAHTLKRPGYSPPYGR